MTTGANQILPFATDVAANVLSQSAYNSDSQRLVGNQPGIARAQLVNKALRQMSAILAGFGQFIANRQANDITDSLTPTQVETYLQAALETRSTLPGIIDNTAHNFVRKSSDGFIEQFMSGISVASAGGHTDVTFPLAFVTTVIDIQCSVFDAAEEQVGWGLMTLTGCRLFTGNTDSSARTVNIRVCGY